MLSTTQNKAGKANRDYFTVPITSLRVDSVLNFDLFIPKGEDRVPVLYRQRDLPITDDVFQRLTDSGHAALLVETGQRHAFHRYVEENLDSILTDPNVPMEQKADLLYSSAQSLVEQVMMDPRARSVVGRSRNLVKTTVGFMFGRRDAFAHLLKVSSLDYYTFTHSVNVFVFTIALSQRLGYTEESWLQEVGLGALLHDVGKSTLDPAIIRARGALTEMQWKAMKLHPERGEEILRQHRSFSDVVLEMVRHHHEKLDGSGYPDGIRDDSLSPHVRISTICDIFDALTTERSYKNALNSYPALQLMWNEMGHQIDGQYFRTLVHMMGHPEL